VVYGKDAGLTKDHCVTNVGHGTGCNGDTASGVLKGLAPDPLRGGEGVVGNNVTLTYNE
jgi:hypothetical protein